MFISFKPHIVLGLLLAAVISPITLVAQELPQSHGPGQQVLSVIDEDYQQGSISLDQKILYQFYAGFKPGALPEKYRAGNPIPIKCTTPLLLEYRQNREKLAARTVAETESLIDRKKPNIQQLETYTSPSGKFTIHYETSGIDAVPPGDDDPEFGGNGIPDYVDWTAAAADSSWRHQVGNLGFIDPVTGQADPYTIYIENIAAYGYTDYGSKRGLNAPTFIVINTNLDTAPYQSNDDVNKTYGAIKVTVAHELKHAIQYANSQWTGEAGSPSWSEMDATLMEEVVYDNVNDYYNYITQSSSVFLSTYHSVPSSYNGVTWSLFMTEKYGTDFWVKTWQKIKEIYEEEKDKATPQYAEMISVMDEVLRVGYNDIFQNAFSVSHMWHYASGPNYSSSDYGFEERDAYPDPNINVDFTPGITENFTDPAGIPGSSARYYIFQPAFVDLGNIAVSIDSNSPDLSIGLLFYLKSGELYARSVTLTDTGITTHNSIWKWNEIEKVGIVVSNSGQSTASYRLRTFAEEPETFELVQNFPNPFNPETRIRFTISRDSDVRLNVYDIAGRKVKTLVNRRLESGFYEVPFNGGGLASGVYIYRLVTGETVITRKMTLIK